MYKLGYWDHSLLNEFKHMFKMITVYHPNPQESRYNIYILSTFLVRYSYLYVVALMVIKITTIDDGNLYIRLAKANVLLCKALG